MENYDITKLYIEDRRDYSWQNDVLNSGSDLVIVQAPHKTGKSYLCRDEIYTQLLRGKESGNILYYDPVQGGAARMAFGLQILIDSQDVACDLSRTNVYVLEDARRDTALYAPNSVIAMAKLLGSGIKFDEIIIDNAEAVPQTILHAALLKHCADSAPLIALGSYRFEDNMYDHKDIWKWLINSPSADVYAVQYGEFCDDVEEDADADFMELTRKIKDTILTSIKKSKVA